MEFEKISMVFPCNPNFVSVIRLTLSGIANRIGFNMDDIEDMKVCISEACTNAIKHSKEDHFDLNFYVFADKMAIEVIDNGIGYNESSVEDPDPQNPKTSGLGLFIIKTLMDEVEVKTCEQCGTIIKMTKMVGVDS